MQELILDNGIKEIAVKKENGDLITVLKINVADGRTAEKFAQLIDRLNKITDEQNEQKKAMDAKYTGRKIVYNGGENVDTEQVIDRSRMNVSYLEKCIEELDLVFGQGTVRNVYRENYEMDEYFIPDEAILNALMIAVKSGIEVNIMIPCMPDHPFVYWATYSYIGDMVMAGANCYTYNNGFLHSKGMIVDGKVLCYGTANMDIRSFALNFEVNAVIYDEKKAQEMVDIFQKDLEVCRQITRDYYVARRLKIRIKEQICRLLSPLL